MQLERENLYQVLSAALLGAAKDNQPPHNRIELTLSPDSIRAVGTNGHVLVVAERGALGPKTPETLVFPRKDAEQLAKIVKPVKGENEQMSLEFTDYKLSVEIGTNFTRQWFVDSAEQGSFPPWVKVLPPVLASSTVEPTTFNPEYFGLIAKVAKIYGVDALTSIPPENDRSPHQWEAPLVGPYDRLSIVIMPMRKHTLRILETVTASPVAAE
jgi:hypothetical protein